MPLTDAIRRLRTRATRVYRAPAQLDILQAAVGRVEARQCAAVGSDRIHDNEFRTFSQFGEDGIIQWLIRRTGTG
ncbi:MAG: hypothetical protein H0W68_02550, partial [Gemmatimonadaceae bacterium]|nr:hypothetical protein [Gemmatimonadaceae bacterium]